MSLEIIAGLVAAVLGLAGLGLLVTQSRSAGGSDARADETEAALDAYRKLAERMSRPPAVDADEYIARWRARL